MSTRRPTPPGPRRMRLALAALLVLPLFVGGPLAPRRAEAGAPPLNETYRDRVHKFSLRIFRDYKAVPLKTDEKLFLCKFRDPKSKGQARGTFDPEISVLKVVTDGSDKPVVTGAGEGGDDPVARFRERMERLNRPKNVWDATVLRWRLTDASKKQIEEIKDDFKEIKSKDKPAVPGKLWQFRVAVPSWSGKEIEVHVTLAEFTKDNTSIIVFMSCGEPLERSFARKFKSIAKSFRWQDDKAKDVETLDVLDGVNITARKRSEIERGMVAGWDVLVSPKKNYIVIYNTKNNKNHRLAKVLAERIELIREQIYEVQFPPAKPITTVCIVRVCADAKEYRAYGGPGGSAGYWSSRDEELVFYDASASDKPDDNTLSVLYHEAFHQYIYYSVGNVAPHSWFNEGHGDYYAGAKLKGRRFEIEPFRWRVGAVKNALVQGPRPFVEVEDDNGNVRKQWEPKGYTPLQDLVRFTQREYYAYPGVSYAQGWSLIYFLREIVPKNRKYREKWGKILDTYFDVLQREVNRDSPLVRGGEGKDDEGEDDEEKDDAGEGDEDEGGGEGNGPAPPAPEKPAGKGGGGEGNGDDGEPEGGLDVARTIFRGRGGPAALKKAVDEAFRGVDWEEFEAAWIQATKRGK